MAGILRWTAVGFLMATLVAAASPVRAQEVLQLTAPAEEYSLGRFKYSPPKVDGWRQIALMKDSLSLVYAEQKDDETIETRFGVTLEAHEIPEGVVVESAAALADLSRKQMAEARKADLVAFSPIEAVPSIDNLYTYRLLVHAPIKDQPDAYEVYYVALAPDKTQYLVMQCITKTQDYGNELYFNEFYGSLASLKYVPATGDGKTKEPAASPGASDAKAPPAGKPAANAHPAGKPPAAGDKKPAAAAKPAGH